MAHGRHEPLEVAWLDDDESPLLTDAEPELESELPDEELPDEELPDEEVPDEEVPDEEVSDDVVVEGVAVEGATGLLDDDPDVLLSVVLTCEVSLVPEPVSAVAAPVRAATPTVPARAAATIPVRSLRLVRVRAFRRTPGC